MKANEIKVRSGDPIAPAWDRLVKWVESIKVIPCEGVRVSETLNGTVISVVNKPQKFKSPFKVDVSYSNGFYWASIRPGIVNGDFPYIKDDLSKSGWRRIDNRDDKGMKYKPERNTPMMKIDLNESSDSGVLYISLRVKPNKAGTIVKPKDSLRIVQAKDSKGPKDGAGYYPLAMVYVSESKKTVEETFQIVHHNMRHVYQERLSDKGKPIGNRNLFFPV